MRPIRRFLPALALVIVTNALAASPASAGLSYSAPVSVPETGLAPSNIDVARGSAGAFVVWDVVLDQNFSPHEVRFAAVRPGEEPAPAQTLSQLFSRSASPQVAGYDSGAAVVWGAGNGIELVRISAAGVPSEPIAVTAPGVPARNPQIVADDSGALTIAYSVRVGPDGRDGDYVEAAFVSPENEVSSAAISQAGWLRDLSLSGGPGGRSVAVWERRPEGKEAKLETTQLSSGDAGPVRVIEASPSRRTRQPQVAMNDRGSATVVWRTVTGTKSDASAARVNLARLNRAGIPGESRVVSARRGFAYMPELAIGSDGRSHVSFLQGFQIRLAAVRPDGRVKRITKVDAGPGRFPEPPSLALDSRDRPILAWLNGIVASSRFSAAGRQQGTEVVFPGDEQYFDEPVVATGEAAGPVVVWPVASGVKVSFGSG